MDDTQGDAVHVILRVGVGQCPGYLEEDVGCEGLGEGLPRAAQRAHQLPQVSARDIVHDQEELAVLLAQLVDLDDVTVGEASDELALPNQALDELGIAGKGREDFLDDEVPFKPCFA